jgi:DNA polymerase III delta subunit
LKKLHPVMVLAGSEDFLRDREKQRLIQAAWTNGYQVVYADSQDQVDSEVSQVGVIAIDPLLIVTTWLPDLTEVPDNVSYLIVLDGDKLPDLPKVAKSSVYTRGATRRERKQAAEKFCALEAKRYGLTLADGLDEAIVNLTGDDLGIVSWEIFKVAALARSKGGVTQITQELISQTIRMATTTPDLSSLLEALASRDEKSLARTLARFGRNGDDPTMLLLRSKGGPVDAVMTWLRICEAGTSQEADYLAGSLGIPSWQIKNRDLPAVKRWGSGRLRRLLRNFAEIERAIVEGRCPSPWLACQSVLLNAVRS